MESTLLVQQKQDEYIKQLASKVDVPTTHNKMLKVQIVQQATSSSIAVDFQVSPSLTLGNACINCALCNLGSSVHLMPHSMCKKLDLRELRPTTISLQLADRSVKYPMGVLENVLIKAGDLYVYQFVILKMNKDTSTPIILGRPFLATTGCPIDVKNGKLSFDVRDDLWSSICLRLLNILPRLMCYRIDVIDSLIRKIISHDSNDRLGQCLLHDGSTNDENLKVSMCA